MAITTAQIALIDILLTHLITISTTIIRVKEMQEDEVKREIEKWEAFRASEMQELQDH